MNFNYCLAAAETFIFSLGILTLAWENESTRDTANCVGTVPFAQCAVPSATEPPYDMMMGASWLTCDLFYLP